MKIAMLVLTVVLLAGCEAVVPYDTGGSRADGIITMSATVRMFDNGIDWAASEHLVLERCQAWGYSWFQAFTGVTSECVDGSATTIGVTTSYSCNAWLYSRNYQCTGD